MGKMEMKNSSPAPVVQLHGLLPFKIGRISFEKSGSIDSRRARSHCFMPASRLIKGSIQDKDCHIMDDSKMLIINIQNYKDSLSKKHFLFSNCPSTFTK